MAFSLILICARVFITVLKIKSIIYKLPVYTAENLKLLITYYLLNVNVYVEVIQNNIPKRSCTPN